MASDFEDIVWSDDTTTIRDVVYTSMPAIVRVAEGFYGGNEAESFSRGDLLKLDSVISVQKVYATVISSWSDAILEDRTGYMQPDHEIIIPLMYKGKVLIARPPSEFKVYHTVTELLTDFPRFIRVESEFIAQASQDQTVRVKVGKRLELDRYLPNQGLIAKYEGTSIVISQNMRGRFVPLPDENHYTLKQVVDTYPLPQYVRFVEDEFEKVLTTDLQNAVNNVQTFTGCVKLTRVFREEVVVGHHKPQLENVSAAVRAENEKYVQRSIVLLPLGREAVNEIEVNVPIYSEPDDYELLAVRNFSQTSPNMDIVEGSLYLEFSKNPRSFYVIDETDDVYEVNDSSNAGPPPVPPRTSRSEIFNVIATEDVLAKAPPKIPPRQKSVSVTEEQDEDYEPVDEPKPPKPNRAPRHPPTKNKKKNYQNAVVKQTSEQPVDKTKEPKTTEDVKESIDGPLLIYEVPDDGDVDYVPLPQKAQKIAVPGPFYKTLKRVQSELVSRFMSKSSAKPTTTKPDPVQQQPPSSPAPIIAPVQSVMETKDSDKSPPSPTTKHLTEKPRKRSPVSNQYVDTKIPTGNRPPKPKPKLKTPQDKKKVGKVDPVIKEEEDEETTEDYDYPDVSKMLPLSQPDQLSKPVGMVQPHRQDPKTEKRRLSQMSVKELVSCLHQCALPNLANLCDEHKMDGQFIADLNDSDLNNAPFNLSLIEVTKLKKMKKGWRPKIE